jgi:cytochrome c biogenesis protein CcmG, thiol:disulfide interchange protein DsbE
VTDRSTTGGDHRVSPRDRRRQLAAAARVEAERRARTRRFSVAGAAVAVTVALVFGIVLAVSHSGGADSAGPASVSTDPASFDLPALTGTGDVRLADYRGKPTVVNFFASWCTQCQAELPGFSQVSKELKGKVNFIGVNALETGDGLAMARRFGIDWWPLARDVEGVQESGLHDALGGQGMPISAFYDAQGKLLFVSPGALPLDQLRATLQQYYGVS